MNPNEVPEQKAVYEANDPDSPLADRNLLVGILRLVGDLGRQLTGKGWNG